MYGNDPLTTDDAMTDEERFEEEQRLKAHGFKPSELSIEEKQELADDLNDDTRSGQLHDDGQDLSDVVVDAENDGND